MKHLKIFTFLLLAFTFSLNAQNNVIDEVIWIIGDDAILKSEVEEQRIRMQYEGIKIDGDPNCVIPEEIAIQKLLLHQAKIDSIVESPSSINQQVEHRLNHFISQIGSKEKMEEYFGKNMVTLREELAEIIEQQMIAQRVRQKIIGDTRVTPSEVRSFFAKLPQDEIPIIPAKVEVQIITMEPTVSVQETERVKAMLRGFKERVEAGEIDFSTLAILYSEDTETARRGGELGFVGRGMLVPEFANAAFNLNDPKRVSQVIETEYGFHLIQLIEKRGDRINVRHILIKPKVLLSEKAEALEKLDTIAKNIRSGRMTFEEAVIQYSADKNTRMNAGIMANPMTGDSRFELKDLPQDIAKVVSNMEIGDVSKPFILNDSGKEVMAIVKVRGKWPTHVANLNDDFQDIRNALLEERGQQEFERWIARKQKETYIYIKEGWRNCEFRFPGWIK